MFGYKLKLVKNEDLLQVELYKKCVYGIQNKCRELIDFMKSGFDINIDTASTVIKHIEELTTFIDLYNANKFSLPGNALMLFSTIDELKNDISKFIDILRASAEARQIVRESSYDPDVDMDEVNECYENVRQEIHEHLNRVVGSIITLLDNILINIKYDLIKITMGVDIIEDYKTRQKLLSKDKSLTTSFVFKQNVVTPGDRKFINKENLKNERNRT